MKTFMRFTVVVAFVALITAALVIVPVAARLSLAADEVLVLDQNAQTTITGNVTDLNSDSFTLVSDSKKIRVDLDRIDDKDSAEKLLANGMRVSVQGKLDNNEIEAVRIIKLQDATPLAAEKAAADADKAKTLGE